METVNNVAIKAARAVWGDPATKTNETGGREPVSGKTGNPAAGEPYDAGNMEPVVTPAAENGGVIPHESTEFAKNTGTAAEADATPDNPSTEMKKRDADPSAGQGDVRSPDDPLTNPKSAPTDIDNTRKTPAGADDDAAQLADSQDNLGPGPRPLGEVAKEHGGDAGRTDVGSKTAAVGAEDGSDAKATPGGADESKEEDLGTGEQHVKTSGFKADGGDFDATLPGAGREAERLREAKGEGSSAAGAIAGDDASKKSTDSPQSPSTSSKEKKSLKDRIKNKLHRN